MYMVQDCDFSFFDSTETTKNGDLCQRWVVFSEIFMGISIFDRRIWVPISEISAASLTIYDIVCSGDSCEVGCFVDKCSTL